MQGFLPALAEDKGRVGEDEGTVKCLAQGFVPVTKAYRSAQCDSAAERNRNQAGRWAGAQRATG